MDTLKRLTDELTEEYKISKEFFKAFPNGKNDYAPHEKSMKLMNLSTHIADLFRWPSIILSTTDWDFARELKKEKIDNKAQLEAKLDKFYKDSLSALGKATETDLEPNWSISMNGQKRMEWTKYGAIRHSLNQITHHRAQLGVYYRLLDIPLPGSYGPSADGQKI